MVWCSNWFTELQSAGWRAGMEAQNGNLGGAATILLDALAQKDSEIGFPNPAPNTADAIRVGHIVAMEAFAASSDPSLPPRLKAQVRYMIVDSMYDVIEWAYYQLDTRYYRHVYDSCRSGYSCRLPDDYYDRVRQLALKFLNVQLQLGPVQASDYLELRVSRAVTAGAKEILNNSTARRYLACPISKLAFTEQQINRFLSCQDTSVPRRDQVLIVRRLLTDARNMLTEAGCRDDYYSDHSYDPLHDRYRGK